MKRNIFFLILIAVLALSGCKKDEPTPIAYVNLKDVNIDASYGKCAVQWTIESNATIADAVVECSSDSVFTKYEQLLMTNTSPNQLDKQFKATITGLENGHTYYIRCLAINKYNSCLSSSLTFRTKSNQKPNVQTNSITNVSYDCARADATLLDWGSETLPNVGFCIANHTNATIDDKRITSCTLLNSEGIISYYATISGLENNATYYVRAYATNSEGTVYGEEKSFTTIAYSKPLVTTSSVTNIFLTSATCGGNVTADGGQTVTERGVCYSISQGPTISDSKIASGGGTGSFTCNLIGLTESKKYYVRAYATNSQGTAYGDEKSFIATCDENQIITYTASSKLTETTSFTTSGLYTKAFGGVTIVSHEFKNGKGTIVFSSSVTTIGGYAFYGCSSLTSVTIPNSVTSIGGSAFSHCSSLTSVSIPNNVTSIGGWAFYGCSSLTSVSIPNSVTSIGDYAFSSCSSLTSVTIPNSVTSIGGSAFSHCSSLTSIIIPNSVTTIGSSAFWGCDALTSVSIPNSVTSIEDETFYSCDALTSVTIGNSVTSIGESAFMYCKKLTSITIPSKVTSIGDDAFQYCTGLTSFICKATTPPTCGDYVFSFVSKSIPVYVPSASISKYKVAYGWKDFTNYKAY